MQIGDFVTTLLARKQEKEQRASRDYGGLVIALADGKADPESAESILTSSGKTPNDLRNDVQTLIELRQAKEVAARKPELVASLAALRYEREQAKREFVKVESAFYERIEQIDSDVAALDARIAKCTQAEHKLLEATEATEAEERLAEEWEAISRRMTSGSSSDEREENLQQILMIDMSRCVCTNSRTS